MLCAALRFIVHGLGLRTIYYHSPVSGTRLKRMKDAPVSIYTALPRRFCFERTTAVPSFARLRANDREGFWMHRLRL